MRLAKSLFASVTAGLISTSSLAATELSTMPWTTEYGAAGVGYIPEYTDTAMLFTSFVGHSDAGEQRLYFQSGYADESNICSYENEYPDDTTMVFSGQAVKMLRWCVKSDDGQYIYQYTPETTRGHSYVINLFKKATTPVEIKIGGETLPFPVIGFTKLWNSAGGNAI